MKKNIERKKKYPEIPGGRSIQGRGHHQCQGTEADKHAGFGEKQEGLCTRAK